MCIIAKLIQIFFIIKNIYSLNNCGIYGLLHSLPSLYTSVRRIKKQEVERGSNFNCEMTFKFCKVISLWL